MSDHSPAPWSCGKCWETDPVTGKARETDSYGVSDGLQGYIVATVWGHSLPAYIVKANARLINAVPGLLSACRDASNVIDNVLENLAGNRDLERIPEPTRSTAVAFLKAASKQCRDAVAKAEGTDQE